ncbi:fibrinogen C domain-containing protein 1-like isoform X1 [Biomphalaria glabrata]|uniref:Fibrinogen C domain-containing protein 1-like isoform X1 n=2 Tax=Biomphalaria glabrata TaxID=6526 RepID=A0A9W2YMY5_BIOGL|nr:fibrinogen C domain-containing protein 1-like isoform X1 [Biomphalaria glabrata]KAI8736459.1 hypothetical protein BgiMline_026711 [Biomphalaria glabrata]
MKTLLFCVAFSLYSLQFAITIPQLDFNANSVAPKELLQTLTLNCSVSSSNTSQSSHVHFMYILHETTGVLASIYKTQYNAVTQDKGLTSAHGTLSSQETEDSYLQLTWASPNVSQSGKYFCGAHGVNRSGAEETINATITINVEKITWEDLVHSFLNLHKDVNEVRQIHTSHKPDVIVLKEYIEDSMVTIHKKINEVKESQETTKQDITRIKEDLNITIASIHRQINEGEERQGIIQQDIMRSNAILNRTLTSIQTNLDEVITNMTQPETCNDVNSSEDRVVVTLKSGLKVMCDTKTDGGGWIIFQRRINGKVDFYRGWKEYRDGFGDYNIGEFYLGNENIYKLTSRRQHELRLDLEFQYKNYNAKYALFKLLGENDKYKLKIEGFSGNLDDSLSYHNNQPFTTFDKDNDKWMNKNCAVECLGGWWYNECHYSNLNGKWGSNQSHQGINWYSVTKFTASASFVEMKMRGL